MGSISFCGPQVRCCLMLPANSMWGGMVYIASAFVVIFVLFWVALVEIGRKDKNHRYRNPNNWKKLEYVNNVVAVIVVLFAILAYQDWRKSFENDRDTNKIYKRMQTYHNYMRDILYICSAASRGEWDFIDHSLDSEVVHEFIFKVKANPAESKFTDVVISDVCAALKFRFYEFNDIMATFEYSSFYDEAPFYVFDSDEKVAVLEIVSRGPRRHHSWSGAFYSLNELGGAVGAVYEEWRRSKIRIEGKIIPEDPMDGSVYLEYNELGGEYYFPKSIDVSRGGEIDGLISNIHITGDGLRWFGLIRGVEMCTMVLVVCLSLVNILKTRVEVLASRG